MNADASTHENADANNYVLSKKAAMVLMYPAVVSQFEKALGSNLGIFHVPIGRATGRWPARWSATPTTTS